MRLTVLSQVPPPIHGSTLMTTTLLRALQDSGHGIALVDRRFSRTIDEVGRFQLRKVGAAVSLAYRVARDAVRRRPQRVILFLTCQPMSFILDVISVAVYRLARRKIVFYIHTVGYRDLARRGHGWRLLVRNVLGGTEPVVVLSSALKSDVEPWVAEARISVIPNTADDTLPGPIRATAGSSPAVVFFSNLIPSKGPAEFIRMSRMVEARAPRARFILAGTPTSPEYQQELETLARVQGAQNLRFAGAITDERQKADLFSDTAVLVFPSLYPFEAQPLVVLEAMKAGIPVVAYDSGSVSDMVKSGVTGVVVPQGATSDLAEAVVSLLSSVEHHRTVAEAAQEAYESTYSLSAFRANWEHALKR